MDNDIAGQNEMIELTLINDSVLGFDPVILLVLDDVEVEPDSRSESLRE